MRISSSRKMVLGLTVVVTAAAIAVFIGMSGSMHANLANAVVENHSAPINSATNSGSTSGTQSTSLANTASAHAGICHRCVVAHPFEAKLVGA